MNVKIHYVQVREFLAQGRGNWVMATVGRETSALFLGWETAHTQECPA